MFNFFKKKPKKVGGSFGAWGLSDWWLTEFTTEEQNIVIDKLVKSDMFQRGNTYTEGEYYYEESQFAKQMATLYTTLGGIASHVQKPETRHIAYKFSEKAESLIPENPNLIDLHYYYQVKIGVFYRNRNEDADALDIAIDACRRMIAIAPEAKKAIHRRDLEQIGSTRYDIHHVGFKQLKIIEEKRKNYAEAIEIAKEAMSQGWAGDWEKDIERIKKKMIKLKSIKKEL